MAFSGIFKSATNLVGGGSISKVAGSAFDLLNPSNARRAISGLLPGGANSAGKQLPNVGFLPQGNSAPAEDDWRVRVSLADGSNVLYKDSTNQGSPDNSLMGPLIATNGVIFPYTPSITVSHLANYTSAAPTHSNYPAHFYNNSEVADITISGEFTVQNQEEGAYLMAAIYFFRSATKMFFGQSVNAGNPPPIVFLDGYGSHYFPHVPCVITNFSHQLPSDVDYLQVPVKSTSLESVDVPFDNNPMSQVNLYDYGTGDLKSESYAPNFGSKKMGPDDKGNVKKMQYSTLTSYTRVPVQSSISISLRPVYSRKNIYERFNNEKFAAGQLLQDKKNGFGGFI